jgi:TIR domain-containing protein
MNEPEKRPAVVEVFYSYAHKDARLCDKLRAHLRILVRRGYINEWYDRDIGAGDGLKGEIDEHLNRADLILLLVSNDFINSDYCYGIEMTRALERQQAHEAELIPIILRPCDWSEAPFHDLKALPTDGKPVTTWRNRDEAFTSVETGVKAKVKSLLEAKRNRAETEVEPARLRQLKDRMLKWQELQDLQTKIFAIQNDVSVKKAREVAAAAAQWDKLIEGA